MVTKVPLTDRQKKIAFATILTDGWIELQKGAVNARLGFQQSVNNKELFDWWKNEFSSIITEPVRDKMQTAPGSKGKLFLQHSIRTLSHPDLTNFHTLFRPNGVKKLIPKVSELLLYLTYETFAIMLMQDGSVKSKDSKGMELHTMCFSFESVARLAIALREKLNIWCHPTKEVRDGKETWTLYISGESFDIIEQQVKPFMLPSFVYKIPPPRVKTQVPALINNPSYIWYDTHKNAIFREDLSNDLI